MFAALRDFVYRWLRPARQPQQAAEDRGASAAPPAAYAVEDIGVHAVPVPYDENLLERARTQWQFGDWESLARLERDALEHHPDRAKLALLAAAGKLQTNNPGAARQLVQLARDWGCGK